MRARVAVAVTLLALAAHCAGAMTVTPVFNVSEPKSIYTSASIARAGPTTPGSGLQFSAGTWLVTPFECATYNADGSAAWSYAWPDASDEVELKTYSLQATSAASGVAAVSVFCVANVIANAGAGTRSVVVLGFAPSATGTPAWRYDFEHNCQTDASDPTNDAAVSADGTTVAVVATCRNATDPFIAQTHVIDAATGAARCTYDTRSLASQANPVSVSLSSDGQYAAWNNWESAYVLDTAKCALRTPPIAMGFEGAVAMTADAQYLLWGYESATISTWNNAKGVYEVTATVPGIKNGTQWYCETIAAGLTNPPTSAGADGLFAGKPNLPLFAVGWTNGNADSLAVDLWTATGPVWSWRGPTSRDDQLVPSDIAISSTGGGYVAVSTWGDYGESADPCPQVYLFGTASPNPLFAYITPGSMFAVDVVALPSASTPGKDDVWVAASGKHVHANVMGNGGDLFAFRVTV